MVSQLTEGKWIGVPFLTLRRCSISLNCFRSVVGWSLAPFCNTIMSSLRQLFVHYPFGGKSKGYSQRMNWSQCV
jgi:hypothetical protein